MKNISIFLLSILLFSCQQKQTKTDSVSSSDSIVAKDSIIVKENKVENEQIGDTIFMNFKNEKDFYVAEGSLDSIHSRVYVKFKNEDLGELNGKITPAGGKGNIRFNQIISPDKSSDGPFGIDLKTNLEQKGNYVLVIGHSQMADNPFYGKFTVQLENKKK
ncbi:hypothetical protein J2Y38_003909 [Flavobacterium sp. 2755]|uniref:hypothetical protein n=1 Tax=Flavobacterium sp. 2755 TaxID=2817765 RepID=UPI002864F12D|nr:hypothetical protein [Flavobacterium sp. 2755]MDR6763685.1 hypothetical protein [Flavobacterium sp. 2755]